MSKCQGHSTWLQDHRNSVVAKNISRKWPSRSVDNLLPNHNHPVEADIDIQFEG